MTKDNAEIREIYENFIKGGGFYVSRLYSSMKMRPVVPKGLEQLKGDELAEICLADDIEMNTLARRAGERFTAGNADIIRLYEALERLTFKLLQRRKGIRLTETQKIYPDLIRGTYGMNARYISEGIYIDEEGESRHFEKGLQLDKIRKTALSYYLDLIEENSEKSHVDYDFSSSKALDTVARIEKKIEDAKDPAVMRKTRRVFRFIDSEKTLSGISDALYDLVGEAEGTGRFLDYEKSMTALDFQIKHLGKEYIFEAQKHQYASSYTLFFNGKAVKTSDAPEFTVSENEIEEDTEVLIEANRMQEDLLSLVRAGKGLRTGNNFLRLASDRTNRFVLVYESIVLAEAALSAMKEVSPASYERAMATIRMTKRNMEDEVWPLAVLMEIQRK